MKKNNRIIFSNATNTDQPLCGVDMLMFVFPAHYIFVFDYILDDTVLSNGLSRVLNDFPYLAGRLKELNTNHPKLSACDSGVLFESECYNENIDEFLTNEGKHITKISPLSLVIDEYTPILQIKADKYNNGSVLSVSWSHVVCDGGAIIRFLKAWSMYCNENHSNKERQPEQIIFDRKYLSTLTFGKNTESPPVEAFKIENTKKRLGNKTSATVKIPKLLVKNLIEENCGDKIASQKTIFSVYLWKIISSVRKDKKEHYAFLQTCDMRATLGLDSKYFGNAIAFSSCEVTKNEVDTSSLKNLFEKISVHTYEMLIDQRKAENYFSFWNNIMNEGKLGQYISKTEKYMMEGELLINDMSDFPLYEINFGSSPPVWVDAHYHDIADRLLEIFPSTQENDDIVIHVTLPTEEMREFSKKIETACSEYS